MCNKETVEILDMFMKAVKIAQTRNREEFAQEISESMALELLKQAFPSKKDFINSLSLTKNILRSNQM